ncbi:MAG: DUF5916 domain-containing protein [Bacteroidota bacterium]
MKKILVLASALLCCMPGTLLSQDSIPKRIYTTAFVGKLPSPKIDGILQDKAWELVEWSGNYVELSPQENTPPTEQTQLKIIYDDKNLYVGFRCFDKDPDGVVRRLSRRDGFDGDWVEINIDSFHDLRTAFSFTLSVSGVKGEEFITNDGGNWDNTWNPIWYAKTNIDDLGWTAEIRIPLSQLRFGKGKNQVWGIQSTRRYFRKEERSVWQRSPINAPGWVSSFGELHGLKNLVPQQQLELQPYVVSSLTTYEAETGNPFRDGQDSQFNAGLDGKIGITNDLTLDFTINPDFGQVEADPSAIALDGFQIFFPEQRPFFVENKNIFDYTFSASRAWLPTGGIDNLFYSRRIGRAPQGFANIDPSEFADQPAVSTILGAAKFSGKTRDGWSIGVLESITEEEKAQISDGINEREEAVEPLTNYFVTRIQKDFNNNNTFIGGIFTGVNRKLIDKLAFLHKSAYSGGLDVTHQWKNRAYYLKGNLVFSRVNGSTNAITRTQQSITHLFQREGADHVTVDTTRTSLTGTGGNLQFGKASGNWRFETGGTWRSPELELNDVGFQLVADDFKHYLWVQYRTTKPLENIRSYGINYTHVGNHDFQGNFNDLSFRVNGWVNFKNNWWLNGSTTISPRRYSNAELRGGPRLRRQPWFDYQLGIISDSRKKLRLNMTFRDLYDFGADNNYRELNTTITYQPTNALQVSLAPFYAKNRKQLQYVTTSTFNNSARYINGTITQETLRFPLRIDYIITPNLSLQYWGQPFISKGIYKHLKYITNPLAKRFEDRFSVYDTEQITLTNGSYTIDEDRDGTIDYSFFQPDFSFVQWRSNMVLRWEYIPGSELYLVWSQDISQFGDFNQGLFEGLNSNILDTKPQNIFLLKATYRFRR